MGKESLYSIDKNIVLYEPWISEDTVRGNKITPNNIIFNNGVASFNGSSSYATFTRNLNGVYSVRIKLSALTPSATQYLLDCRSSGGTGYIRIDSTTAISASSGTIYVDGLASSTISSNTKEILVSGITLISTLGYIGRINSSSANYLNSSIDAINIYNITIPATFVKNLYNNKAYKPFIPHGEILGSELITNGDFSNGSTGWTLGVGWNIDSGMANRISSASTSTIFQSAVTTGKMYKITFTVLNYVSGNILNDGASSPIIRSSNGTYTEIYISRFAYVQFFASANFIGSIDNVSVKEVLSTATPILDVDAYSGIIKNKANSTAITNTAVRVVRDGKLNVMNFNGSTSKLDCGNYNGLTGDLTISVWIKQNKFNNSDDTVISNSKLKFRYSSRTNMNITSDGGTIGSISFSGLNSGYYINIVFTRKSSGLCVPYKNGVIVTSESSTGTPSAGTSNITIGNDASLSRYFSGNIASVKIYSGILSTEEISQIFVSEKSKFNL